MTWRLFICLIAVSAIPFGDLWAQTVAEGKTKKRLLSLSFDELMDVEVTSVSKKPQKITESAAAVFVLTSEDIRRSGARTIPDMLRMVPGMHVAQSNTNTWGVSSRGFTDVFSNKLLVLIDGRSVYTPLFAGVYWHAQDTLIEDIDRIEVIRGPGATLWGANAVNGIINIITKNSKNTNGAYAEAGGGNEEQAFGAARYGAEIADAVWARFYAKSFSRDRSTNASVGITDDYWSGSQAGFRLDAEPQEGRTLGLQGDIYYGDLGATGSQPILSPPFQKLFDQNVDYSGGNILGSWSEDFTEDISLFAQFYYDRTNRDGVYVSQSIDTYDLDIHTGFKLADWNELLVGIGYRAISDQLDPAASTRNTITPKSRDTNLFSGFVQDQIEIIEETLALTVGTKIEENDFTGFEAQPSARLLYSPDEKWSLWGSVSRAVRTPSRVEDDADLTLAVLPPSMGVPPTDVRFTGSRDYDSEELIAYEVGIRGEIVEGLRFDLATFFNDYDELRSIGSTEPRFSGSPFPLVTANLVPRNEQEAEAYGGELVLDYQAFENWRLQGTYSYLHLDVEGGGATPLGGSTNPGGGSPENLFTVRSLLSISEDVEFDSILRYSDRLSGLGIDSYLELDIHLAWRPCENLELSVVGRNLLDDEHPEFASNFVSTAHSEIQRSVYGKVAYRF